MKKLVLILALLFGVFGAYAEDAFHIYTKSGDVVTMQFAHSPEITFQGSKMTVSTSTGANPVVIELDDIDAIHMRNQSGLEDAVAEGISIVTDSEGIHFCNVPQGANVMVATIEGRLVVSTTVDAGEYTLSTSDMAKGIYIIKINQFTTKVIL